MSGMKIYLTNTKQVQADFRKQDKDFKKAIKKSLGVIGKKVKGSQQTILAQRVVKWTGALAKSVSYRVRGNSVTIGGTKLKYVDWIERGGRGGFLGYWYMKTSLSMNKAFILERLRKDMGSHAKLKY